MYEQLKKCPLCGSLDIQNYLIVKDHAVSQESFSISKCHKCGFLFTNPRPDLKSIGTYYLSEDYISHEDKATNPLNLLYKMVRNLTIKQKVRWLNKYSTSKGRLLDFGCGTGYFIKAAKKKHWDVVGLEPNEKAASIARKKHGLRIIEHISGLDNEKKFDAISLFHVLEHVHDLKGTIEYLRTKLKKRGVLLIALPNYNSYDSSVYKENWAALDVPRHLYHFTFETMERLAQESQLKIKAVEPMVFDSYYVSLLTEGYIKNKNKYIRSIINGYKSNTLAKKDNNYSSLLFILKKI